MLAGDSGNLWWIDPSEQAGPVEEVIIIIRSGQQPTKD
jgi:hypothetical protein